MKSFGLILGCMIAVLSASGCSGNPRLEAKRFSGTLEMTEHSIGFSVPGTIKEMKVEEGDTVKKGQLIALLDHYDQAKKDFERAAGLVKSGGVSQEDYEHLHQAMEDQSVVSPIDGVVLIRVRVAGEVVPAGAPVAVIGDTSELWVRIFVPEDLINRISMHQKARVFIDGRKNSVEGTVRFISPKAEFTPRNIQTPEERATQTFAVKVMLTKPDPSIHPGTSADVTLAAGEN